MVDKQTTRHETQTRIEAWQAFVAQQTLEFGKSTVDRWLASLELQPSPGRALRLQAKDALQMHWFEEHIRPKLGSSFLDDKGQPIPVQLLAPNQAPRKRRTNPKSLLPRFPSNWTAPDLTKTFDDFSTQDDNRMGVKFLKDLAQEGTAPFNPIYLWGPTHSGKSHLLHALAASLQRKERVILTSAALFAEHVVAAMRAFDMQRFREAYRSADYLIVDDIEDLGYKASSQEEFFHTFNTLHMAGKPIIISSKCPPNALLGIEPRLISRFEWGIVLPLSSSRAIPAKTPTHLQADRIVAEVASFYKITSSDILGPRQQREFSKPRQVAIFLCRDLLHMPYKRIGKFFNRNHSTVITSIRSVKNDQKQLRQILHNIVEQLVS